MTIDTNVSPYFDDFNSVNGHHQILFKPGYAVQARELTQSQSILRNQIAKFGDHIFKHGSVVLPGNVSYDVNVCAVKLTSIIQNLNAYIGGTIVGTSGLEGKIKAVSAPTSQDLYTTLYVSFYNTGDNSEKVFGDSEVVSIKNILGNITSSNITISSYACTGAVMASINSGVFYINSAFVEVSKQSIVISKYSSTANCKVLLRIDEYIVNSEQDTALLDPAQGSYNYAAPGADRIKITLTLESLPLTTDIGSNYVEVLRFNNGLTQEFNRYPKYNELEKSLARRTYDESGDYISDGLNISLFESQKKQFNGGKLVNGSPNYYAVEISAGKAYINGFESENINNQIILAPKGRVNRPNHIKEKTISIAPNFGQYILVTNIKSLPEFSSRAIVTLYDSINENSTATQIGTATVLSIDLHETNSSDQTNIYKIYVTEMSLSTDTTNIGSIRYANGSADVIHKLTIPIQGADFIATELINFGSTTAKVSKWIRGSSTLYVTKPTVNKVPVVGVRVLGATSLATGVVMSSRCLNSNILSSPIINLPIEATFKVRKNIGTSILPVYVSDITYTVQKEISIIPTGGSGSFTIPSGTIDALEIGNVIVTSTTGVLPLSSLSLSGDGLTITYTGPANAVKICCSVTKSNVQNKTKILTSNASSADSGLVASAIVMLTRADVYRIISVTSTIEGDVTNQFSLNNGQTDYAYLRSSLVLIGKLPTGLLTATYEYFSHSGTGDYFSVDSYTDSGVTDFYTAIRPYKSISDAKQYDLRNCLDFRPKFDAYPASKIEMLVVDSRIVTDVQYYVPRIDSVMFGKNGNTYIEYGVPDELPIPPVIAKEAVQLGTIFVPAYTYSILDMIVYPSKFKGYKMRDILHLENRVDNIEKYSLLTQTETSLINKDIIDSTTGLSRYKSGYLVETFSDHEVISDITNKDFKSSYISGRLYPAMETFSVALEYVSTTGKIIGDPSSLNIVASLPYTTSEFANQSKSTRITNINPFAVFSWKGNLTLVPSFDTFVVTNILPPVYETIKDVVVETWVLDVQRPWNFQPVPGNIAHFVSSNTTVIN